MPRHSYNFGAPSDNPVVNEPDDIKREFARRLQSARIDKGFNQSELARAAAKHMADRKFGRDLIGPYERALKLPSPAHLSAMARALGKTPEWLMPFQGVPGSNKNALVTEEMRSTGEGKAWIRINRQVPYEVALKIMEMVHASDKAAG